MEFVTVNNGRVDLNVAIDGEGPLLLCVHGWPELWYSWRHQIEHFSNRGYRVAALDVRGYGGSSKPHEISAYSMRELAGDVATIVQVLGYRDAVLFGHDWGSPIAWIAAQLYPERISAVALLSVPFIPQGQQSFLDLMRDIYRDRFFYQLYFQDERRADAELERDVRASLRRIYFALSGSAPLYHWLQVKPKDASLLEGLEDPEVFPGWMSDTDLEVYFNAFRAGGFRGPLNRYRAQDLDFADLRALAGKPLLQPSCFIGGDRDMVRAFIPGMDLYEEPGVACADFRGAVIVPGIGHWVQQEAPDATNEALDRFLHSVNGST